MDRAHSLTEPGSLYCEIFLQSVRQNIPITTYLYSFLEHDLRRSSSNAVLPNYSPLCRRCRRMRPQFVYIYCVVAHTTRPCLCQIPFVSCLEDTPCQACQEHWVVPSFRILGWLPLPPVLSWWGRQQMSTSMTLYRLASR